MNLKSLLLTARVSACTPAGEQDIPRAERQSTVAVRPRISPQCQLPPTACCRGVALFSLLPAAIWPGWSPAPRHARGKSVRVMPSARHPYTTAHQARTLSNGHAAPQQDCRRAQTSSPAGPRPPLPACEHAARSGVARGVRALRCAVGLSHRPRRPADDDDGRTACSPPAQKPQKGGVHAARAREREASPADTRTRTSSLAQEWSSPASVASCLSFRCWQSRNLPGFSLVFAETRGSTQ